MGANAKNRFKVLTGTLSGLVFLFLSHLAFAGTDETGGLPQSQLPAVSGRQLVSNISNIFMIVGIAFAVITVMIIGIRFAIVKNSEEAAKTYDWLKYVIIGSIILTILTTVIGLVVGFEDKFYKAFELPRTSTPPGAGPEATAEDNGEDNFIVHAIVAILNGITNLFVWVGKVIGFKPISELLFSSGSVFTEDQYKFMLSFYWLVTLVATAFIAVMIGKTAIQLIASGYSARKRADLMEEIYTWFEVILLIAAYPLIFAYLCKFFDLLTGWLYRYVQAEYTYMGNNNFATSSDVDTFISQVNTQNLLNTAIVKVMYAYMFFKLNMIFLVRKIVLGVFFLFAPIAAALWGVKKDSNVMNVWIGEIITNASMGFFYAFALLAILHLINGAGFSGWFFSLLAMWMLPQLGGTLRNMLQNWFQRMSGINEENAVNPFFTGVFPMIKGSTTSLAHAFSGAKAKTETTGTTAGTTGGSEVSTATTKTGTPTGGSFGGAVGSGLATATASTSAGTSKASGFSEEIAKARNEYAGTDLTRKAFLQSFGAFAGSSVLYKAGNALHHIANATHMDNPMFAAFASVAGSALKIAGSSTKIGQAMDYATLHRMATDPNYGKLMQKIAPVSNFLTQNEKGHLLTEAIKTGKVDKVVQFLNEKGSPVPVDFADTVQSLHEAFKKEREVTEKQLGISKLGASLRMGKGAESFETYFYKKHPYRNAAEAFIFKV
ncbi:pilin [Anaerocellum danielii]|uniref:Pilin n=1 Tax=Anaerocellum danielii TaxID=1387557 RepID=A0ABZ0TXQ0_9FIRM|nr:pilin [Caldicellulosiruptor danielii]WPX08217.1 pilin [Caldicellulosiruptor danielii]